MTTPAYTKVIVVNPTDISQKISDITEKIISKIMIDSEVDVIGIGDAMFLTCSAVNLSREIAKINISKISLETIQEPTLGKTAAIYIHLSQSDHVDFEKLVAEEEKLMDDIGERTISVGHEIPAEKLITRSLMALARFNKIKLIAAGGSINQAISTAQKLAEGQISRDPLGIKLVYLYSINMRNDPAKRISAISIYVKKCFKPESTDFQQKLENVKAS